MENLSSNGESRAAVESASAEGGERVYGGKICGKVCFKPGLKEKWSYG